MKKSVIEIVQKDKPILRLIAKSVPIEDIKTKKIKKILQNMSVALKSQTDGVAIAAPQIDIPLRIFIISRNVEIMTKGLEKEPEVLLDKIKDDIYINPIINKISKKKQILDEGCLADPPLFGKVERAEKATVTAYDENGKKFTRGGSGLLAQIFQHEIDHLNGILFIDKATEIAEAPIENPNNDYDK